MYGFSHARFAAIAAITLIGAGCAEPVTPVETPDRPVGVFDLKEAEGKALPATVFEGIFLDENDNFYTLSYVAKSGYLSIDADGNYEHRVFHDVRVDGKLTTDGRWVDRGRCTTVGSDVSCVSSYNENVAFSATFSGNSLQLSQDLTGEGFPARYRYDRQS
jgi:hypothetical protein